MVILNWLRSHRLPGLATRVNNILVILYYSKHGNTVLIFLTFWKLSLSHGSFSSSRNYLVEFTQYTSSKSSTKWHDCVRCVARTKTYCEAQECKTGDIRRCTALEMMLSNCTKMDAYVAWIGSILTYSTLVDTYLTTKSASSSTGPNFRKKDCWRWGSVILARVARRPNISCFCSCFCWFVEKVHRRQNAALTKSTRSLMRNSVESKPARLCMISSCQTTMWWKYVF